MAQIIVKVSDGLKAQLRTLPHGTVSAFVRRALLDLLQRRAAEQAGKERAA